MEKSLKYINIVLFLSISYLSNAQCVFVDPTNTYKNSSGETIDSKNGFILPASGTIRVLVVFAEVNYDVGTNPNPNSTSGWPIHSLPIWANQLFDANVPTGAAQGMITRYFQLASSGKYNVIGDYLLAPTNGGIFQVLNSQIIQIGENQALSNAINNALGGNFVTGHGLNNAANFDNWTLTSSGLPKITPSIDSPFKFDHVMFIWRNSNNHPSGIGGANSGSKCTVLGYSQDTYSFFGTYDGMPLNIARHEFSHLIYGGNNFHCGGGGYDPPNWPNYWVQRIGGWSNMGLSGCSLLSWNAWDRQRMDWKATGNQYNPSAREANNAMEVNGNIDAGNSSQAGTYTLRDFVTSGDAIRIKLPFTSPSTEYPEYIWIENHNGIGMNSVPFDQFQYQSASCVQPAVYGLYMYLQIDREIRQSTNYSDIYGGYHDYLRPITADGFYDKEYETTPMLNNCINNLNYYPYKRVYQNPLTGGGDQENYEIDLDADNILTHANERENVIENINGTYLKNLFGNGNSRHAFTYNGNRKLGIGTNPSSSSMMNLVSWDNPAPTGMKNLRKIYLNGVSVEILNQYPNGNIQVKVRFDDVDINNDVRWCADEIILNPVSTSSGYSLNLISGKTINLDQSRTATRIDNPVYIASQKVFASPTLFRCTINSWFNMSVYSKVILLNQSSFILESGSRMDVNDGSTITINTGCTLYIKSGANLNVNGSGKIEIQPGAFICIESGSSINLSSFNSVINLRPGYINGVNPSLGITSNCVASPETYATTGSGKINTYLSDIFIQNETLTGNRYVSGNTISAGTNVTSTNPSGPGPVLIKSGSNTVLDAEGNIVLDKGFEIESGALFEAK